MLRTSLLLILTSVSFSALSCSMHFNFQFDTQGLEAAINKELATPENLILETKAPMTAEEKRAEFWARNKLTKSKTTVNNG